MFKAYAFVIRVMVNENIIILCVSLRAYRVFRKIVCHYYAKDKREVFYLSETNLSKEISKDETIDYRLKEWERFKEEKFLEENLKKDKGDETYEK